MANITVKLTDNKKLIISFNSKRQARHLRISGVWTDWMLSMEDFRDFITPLEREDVDRFICKLLSGENRIKFKKTRLGQEYKLSDDKKIIRRLGPGIQKNEYQSVALFVKNNSRTWPPPTIKITLNDLLKLIQAMITLDCPKTHCVKDSLRNCQYLLAIFWLKKNNPTLLSGKKKPNANEIFRISLVK